MTDDKHADAFARWLDLFTAEFGRPTERMTSYLRAAFRAGVLEGKIAVTEQLRPAAIALMETAEVGLRAYEALQPLAASMAEVIGADEPPKPDDSPALATLKARLRKRMAEQGN